MSTILIIQGIMFPKSTEVLEVATSINLSRFLIDGHPIIKK